MGIYITSFNIIEIVLISPCVCSTRIQDSLNTPTYTVGVFKWPNGHPKGAVLGPIGPFLMPKKWAASNRMTWT